MKACVLHVDPAGECLAQFSNSMESSDPAVVAVNESGYVQAVNGGTAVIKAIALDNEVSAQIEITVESKVTGITVDPAEVIVLRAETVTLQAKVEPSDANNQNVIWTSSDESVATIDENGVVTAHTIGLATMTATTEEGGYQASSTVESVRISREIIR